MNLLQAIRDISNEEYIRKQRIILRMEDHSPHIPKKLEQLLTELTLLLPKHEFASGRVDTVGTTAKASTCKDYYPEGSFYRISITYSAQRTDQPFYYRSATVHYTQNMEFICVQHHYNEPEGNWHATSSQFEDIFKTLS